MVKHTLRFITHNPNSCTKWIIKALKGLVDIEILFRINPLFLTKLRPTSRPEMSRPYIYHKQFTSGTRILNCHRPSLSKRMPTTCLQFKLVKLPRPIELVAIWIYKTFRLLSKAHPKSSVTNDRPRFIMIRRHRGVQLVDSTHRCTDKARGPVVWHLYPSRLRIGTPRKFSSNHLRHWMRHHSGGG